jgi:hypothetical protein
MAISLSSQDRKASLQLAKAGRRVTRLLVNKTFSLLGITTIAIAQIPVGQAQQNSEQLWQTNYVTNRIQIAKLVARGVDRLRSGDYQGAIADFRQVSHTIPKQDGIVSVFDSYEQIALRRRSGYQQQGLAAKSTAQELQKLKFLLSLSDTLHEVQSFPNHLATNATTAEVSGNSQQYR